MSDTNLLVYILSLLIEGLGLLNSVAVLYLSLAYGC